MAHTHLTDKQIAEELRFQMKLADMPVGDIGWRRVYDIRNDEGALELACGAARARLVITTVELLMPIDAFSERHIIPVVNALKAELNNG